MTHQDQIITDTMAEAIQADAEQAGGQFAWIIMRDQPDHPGRMIARFANGHPTVYVLRADSLTAIRGLLPLGLRHSDRQPADPPEVMEVWFSVS